MHTQPSRKLIALGLLLLVAPLVITGCTPNKTSHVSQQQTTTVETANGTSTVTYTATSSASGPGAIDQYQSATIITPEQIVLTAEKDGQTALELLSANAKVAGKEFGDAGTFIESINGKSGDAEHYWAFYVNGEYAQQAADKTTLRRGDMIKFEYQKVTDSPMVEQ